jgi:transposase
MLVPDQLKSAVKKADWCEPEINATTAEMAQHYGTAVVPARPGKPKDKAKVEQGVLVAQRWILACLRNRRFFSLEELNAAIRELLEELNTRPFKKLEGCRRTAFEALDRPAMKPLPPRRYELGQWRLGVGVNVDYHVELEGRYYSVPCELIQEKVDLRVTATVVEVFRDGKRIASHARSFGPKGTAVTNPEHRPRAHREFGDWPPERLVTCDIGTRAASRVGQARVPRARANGCKIRKGASRGGMRPRARDRQPDTQERRGDPEERPRQDGAADRGSTEERRARKHPRRRVFRSRGDGDDAARRAGSKILGGRAIGH